MKNGEHVLTVNQRINSSVSSEQRAAAPRELSEGLAQGPRVAVCGIQTNEPTALPEHKQSALTTRPPLPMKDHCHV
ncbi:hypothetical protein ATANTOWER_017313 [Ataeniobius toweri]|uniref:Uncharacterized protein n=1 Tax=Ataeniobius toweri TaxID=208326 RepID=A0ABU7AS32_9TELE|nr:hypothetical protein [Ataeniobius toweri]